MLSNQWIYFNNPFLSSTEANRRLAFEQSNFHFNALEAGSTHPIISQLLAAYTGPALEKFAAFMMEMTGPMAAAARERGPMVDANMPGVPLRSSIKTSQGESVHEITKMEKTSVDATLFDVPAGYAKESMEDMGAARGHR